jgi:UDP-glucose 4-epimerase
MKKYLVVIGGAGFVGSNLIELLLKKTNYKIISYDNYSSGKKINEISNVRVNYITGHTNNINKFLSKKRNNIKSIFHFGEFARIHQSFENLNECVESNTNGTFEVFKFCLENNIKLIYSATSASLGKKGNKNLSPYAFTKSKNLELLENFKKWFKFRYEVIFFYNVYGPRQISKGRMATVIGIFENHYKRNQPLPIVRPGSQSRRFTHIQDTIEICYKAWKLDKCKYYSISNKKNYKIREVAKLFNSKVKFLPTRKGERFASELSNISSNNKIHRYFGKIQLTDYIKSFLKSVKK